MFQSHTRVPTTQYKVFVGSESRNEAKLDAQHQKPSPSLFTHQKGGKRDTQSDSDSRNGKWDKRCDVWNVMSTYQRVGTECGRARSHWFRFIGSEAILTQNLLDSEHCFFKCFDREFGRYRPSVSVEFVLMPLQKLCAIERCTWGSVLSYCF
jgi:hypothetical protein